jgi:hypothetical protein
MSKTNDGGPAFPIVEPDTSSVSITTGMSLRDYFAAAALQGLMANSQYPVEELPPAQVSVDAYYYADYMLAERERGNG